MDKCEFCGISHRQRVKVTTVVTIKGVSQKDRVTTKTVVLCPLEAQEFYGDYVSNSGVSLSMEDVLL